jgi:hypothetical protein
MLLAAAILAGACAAAPRQTVGLDQVPPGSKCTQTSALDSFKGMTASPELGARMMTAARAPHLRWVAHGAMITMEYNESRLTVRLDPQSRVASATCG